ncbi:hypothetical protein MA16_Dca003846 [Dendrobium catenatum]|uniref:Uncharacterized protein n=1 Tax=Dendrobium catenatum TaxID=906689 RepID=A0A2I0X1P8_9ASPA|nr:hypothetical protein MA16_Dca003846 [Dendrobium catenatum]
MDRVRLLAPVSLSFSRPSLEAPSLYRTRRLDRPPLPSDFASKTDADPSSYLDR